MAETMRILKKFFMKFTIGIIYPVVIYVIIGALSMLIVIELVKMQSINSVVHQRSETLSEKRSEEIEKRRQNIIESLDDYQEALDKSNGGILEDDEVRIIVN